MDSITLLPIVIGAVIAGIIILEIYIQTKDIPAGSVEEACSTTMGCTGAPVFTLQTTAILVGILVGTVVLIRVAGQFGE